MEHLTATPKWGAALMGTGKMLPSAWQEHVQQTVLNLGCPWEFKQPWDH